MRDSWKFMWWWGVGIVLLASGCAAHHHGEPINRGWAESYIALEPTAEKLVVTAVTHRGWRDDRAWCYAFETSRTSGEFCSAEDLGYAAGDILRLVIEEDPQ